jgi:hypothetical protein
MAVLNAQIFKGFSGLHLCLSWLRLLVQIMHMTWYTCYIIVPSCMVKVCQFVAKYM